MAAHPRAQRLVGGIFMDLLRLVCLSDVTKHDVQFSFLGTRMESDPRVICRDLK